MVLGQEPKIYLFLGVYGAEDILRLRAALCFFVFFRDGCKENLHRLKKASCKDSQKIIIFQIRASMLPPVRGQHRLRLFFLVLAGRGSKRAFAQQKQGSGGALRCPRACQAA